MPASLLDYKSLESLTSIAPSTTDITTYHIREGVKKKTDLFGTLSQSMGRWVQRWVQSPKLFSENNHSVIFTANIQKCPKTCTTLVGRSYLAIS